MKEYMEGISNARPIYGKPFVDDADEILTQMQLKKLLQDPRLDIDFDTQKMILDFVVAKQTFLWTLESTRELSIQLLDCLQHLGAKVEFFYDSGRKDIELMRLKRNNLIADDFDLDNYDGHEFG